MANWTASTLLSRTLELIEASGPTATGVELTKDTVLADPTVIDGTFSKGSDLIEFLKQEVIKEAMKGSAHVSRPTPKKRAPKPPKPVEPVAPTTKSDDANF